jgi:hypothetical protein
MTWDGSFPQAEYQITFIGSDKKPISGIQLRVEDGCGHNCFKYPVTNYLAGTIPTTDEKGVLTCHHISTSVEFGGHCSHLFWLLPVGECESPTYICHFVLKGKEVFWCDFRDLKRRGRYSHRAVRRDWNWGEFDLSPPRYAIDGFPGEQSAVDDVSSGCSREVFTARQAIVSSIIKRKEMASNDLEFPVYRQTIIVDAQH